MDAIAPVGFELLTFYLTLAIMGVGFGLMVRGPFGAAAAARFFFARPFAALWDATVTVVLYVVQQTFSLLTRTVAALWHLFLGALVDPIARLLRRVLHAIFFPRRS